jgi:hypothetical protein
MRDLVTYIDKPDVTHLFARLFEKASHENQLPSDVKAAMAKHDEQNEKILVVVRYLLETEVICFDDDMIRGIIYQGGLIGMKFPEDPVERRFEQNAIIATLIEDTIIEESDENDPRFANVLEIDSETEYQNQDLTDAEYDHIRSNVVDINSNDIESLGLNFTQILERNGYAATDISRSALEREASDVQLAYFIQEFLALKMRFLNVDNLKESGTARLQSYNLLHENITNILRNMLSLGHPEACLLAALMMDDGIWFYEQSLSDFTMKIQDHFLHYAMEDIKIIAEEKRYFGALDMIGFYLTSDTGNEIGEDNLDRVIAYVDSIDVDDKEQGNKVLKLLRQGGGPANLLGLLRGVKRYAFFRELEVVLESGDVVKIKDLKDEGGDWEEDYGDDYDDNEEQ